MASDEPMASGEPVTEVEAAVTGVMVLPAGSSLEGAAEWSIELQDTSLADAPAELVGADGGEITDTAASEIAFEIIYDPGLIEEVRTYTLSARVVDADDSLLFTNDTSIPVLTDDAPTEDVDVPLVQVASFSPMASEEPAG